MFFVLAAVFGVSLTAGGVVGALRTPNFDNRTDIVKYVAANAKSSVTYAKDSTADGKLAVRRNEVVRFPTGILTWVYDAASSTPAKAIYDPSLDGAVPTGKKKLTYTQAMGAIAVIGPVPTAVEATGQVRNVLKAATGPDKARLILGMLFAAGTGFGLGYMLAYSEKPDRESKAFEDQLGDPFFWILVQNMRRGLGAEAWKYYESGGSIVVERLADGSLPRPTPVDAIIALQQVGEALLTERLSKQERITLLDPSPF